MEYHISVNENGDGLLRYDSPEAERFIRPVVYPTSSCLMRVMADLTAHSDGQVIVNGADLGGRCGVGEEKIAKALSRLSEPQHGIVALEAIDEDTTSVSVNQWLNPPRASARAQRYPPSLSDEFDEFLAEAEVLLDSQRVVATADQPSVEAGGDAMSI